MLKDALFNRAANQGMGNNVAGFPAVERARSHAEQLGRVRCVRVNLQNGLHQGRKACRITRIVVADSLLRNVEVKKFEKPSSSPGIFKVGAFGKNAIGLFDPITRFLFKCTVRLGRSWLITDSFIYVVSFR